MHIVESLDIGCLCRGEGLGSAVVEDYDSKAGERVVKGAGGSHSIQYHLDPFATVRDEDVYCRHIIGV